MCRGQLVGVINAQHRHTYAHGRRDIQLLSTIGLLAGAEIELARMEEEIWKLTKEVRTLKTSENAK